MSTPASPTPERRVGALELPPDTSSELMALLSAAAGPVTEDELAEETTAVAAFLAQRGDLPVPRHRLPVRSIRIAAATLVTSVVLGGGLAAADVLPAPAQRWVSKALNVIGIQVPSPGRGHSVDAAASPTAATQNSVPAPSDVSSTELPSTSRQLIAAAGGTADGTGNPGDGPAPAPPAAAPDVGGHDEQGNAQAGDSTAVTPGGASSSPVEASSSNGDGAANGNSSPDASGRGNNPKSHRQSATPARRSNNTGNQSTNSPGSPAHGKPASPGNSVAAHLAAPGQGKKSAGQGQSDTAAPQGPGNGENAGGAATGSADPTGTGSGS